MKYAQIQGLARNVDAYTVEAYSVVDEYKREREDGATAETALVRAKRLVRVARLSQRGLVRLRVLLDESPDLSYLDQRDCFRESDAKRERARAERDGMYGIVGEYRLGGRWHTASSVWGFIGDDWKGSGSDLDILAETVAELRTLISDRCPTCRKPRGACAT